ncbi:MAG: ABC transporter ATP-binding protein, partial [Pseudomonadota bacterium]
MFDEPLTVIDPELKWKLRSKLKELHQTIAVTMIYVTHDQTEALTFADQVVVMQDGVIVQIGTPVELFERPQHTFVGHFIGSPGMNILPCEISDGASDGVARFQGQPVQLEGPVTAARAGPSEIGVRPEFVRLAEQGIPAIVRKAADLGRHTVLEAVAGDRIVHAILQDAPPEEGSTVHLAFEPAQTRLYTGGWIATEAASAGAMP